MPKQQQPFMPIFPPTITTVYAADASGHIKARLRVGTAAMAVKKKRAVKISDNLVQYKRTWCDEKPIELTETEIALIGTVSRYTQKPGYLDAEKGVFESIMGHNII